MNDAPLVSIAIPIYNEEKICADSVTELREKLKEFGFTYEILLAENGSRDRTVEIGQKLAERFPEVQLHSLGEPNYGKALKQAILRAKGKYVICDEIDLCDTDFYHRALELLQTDRADMVVGSKVMQGAQDARPMFRHMATLILNGMLRVAVGFRGTDTHGLKAFRRDALLDVAHRCVVDKDLFASEFVIRAYRENKRVVEIPLHIAEKRPPSINLLKRVPNVLKNMARLTVVIRFGKTRG